MAKDFSIRFYRSSAWKKCREGYISSVQGLCERCMAKGKLTPGVILHHKKHLTPQNITDPFITLSWSNLEYLCKECHNEEHFGSAEITREGYHFDERGYLIEDAPHSD